jgi:hypothetical protein
VPVGIDRPTSDASLYSTGRGDSSGHGPSGAAPFDLVGYDANAVNQYAATANPAEAFAYDADGNLTQDDGYDYSWDSENRLVSITPLSPLAGRWGAVTP